MYHLMGLAAPGNAERWLSIISNALPTRSAFGNDVPNRCASINKFHIFSHCLPLWARGPQRLGLGAELTHTATGEW